MFDDDDASLASAAFIIIAAQKKRRRRPRFWVKLSPQSLWVFEIPQLISRTIKRYQGQNLFVTPVHYSKITYFRSAVHYTSVTSAKDLENNNLKGPRTILMENGFR